MSLRPESAIVRSEESFTTQHYVQLEEKVGKGERLGLEARHEFGAKLRSERVAGELPPGRLDQVVQATGCSRSEISYRMRFAELYPDQSNALESIQSWHAFCSGSTTHVSHNAGDNEWYTPAVYIEAAVIVMGGIDLDPASTSEANEVVEASTFYGEADNALERDWQGRVWMNPPYARPLIDGFCGKLAEEFAADKVSQACVLVNNATETGWFHALAEVASAFCFPRHRVKFWHPRKESTPLQGQAVIYLGDNVDGFRTAFVDFGFTVVA